MIWLGFNIVFAVGFGCGAAFVEVVEHLADSEMEGD